MQRTKAWLLLVFGPGGNRHPKAPTEGNMRSEDDRTTLCPVAPILKLLIRLSLALVLVLGLIIRILELL